MILVRHIAARTEQEYWEWGVEVRAKSHSSGQNRSAASNTCEHWGHSEVPRPSKVFRLGR